MTNTNFVLKKTLCYELSLSNKREGGEYSKTYKPGWVEDFFGMMNWKANNFRIPINKINVRMA